MDMIIKSRMKEKMIKLTDVNLISASSLKKAVWKDKFNNREIPLFTN
jgi:hypothetical protein